MENILGLKEKQLMLLEEKKSHNSDSIEGSLRIIKLFSLLINIDQTMKKMKNPISEIQVTPVKPKDGLIAFVSFVLFGSIYCSSVAVYTRPTGGVRLVYPARKVGDKQVSVFYPINSQIGSKIESEVALYIKELQTHHI